MPKREKIKLSNAKVGITCRDVYGPDTDATFCGYDKVGSRYKVYYEGEDGRSFTSEQDKDYIYP